MQKLLQLVLLVAFHLALTSKTVNFSQWIGIRFSAEFDNSLVYKRPDFLHLQLMVSARHERIAVGHVKYVYVDECPGDLSLQQVVHF